MSDKPDNNKRPNGSWRPLIMMLVVSIVLTALFWFTMQRFKQGTVEEIKYSEFMDMLYSGQVESVEISTNTITIHPKTNTGSKIENNTTESMETKQTEDSTAGTGNSTEEGVGQSADDPNAGNNGTSSEGSSTSVNPAVLASEADAAKNNDSSTEAQESKNTEASSGFKNPSDTTTAQPYVPSNTTTSLGGQKKTYTTIRVYDLNLIDRLEENHVEYEEVSDTSNSWWFSVLQFVLMLGAIYLVMSLFMRMMNKNGMLGGIGKSRAKMYVEKQTGVTFADVAGQEEAKESLVEMVDFLHNPKRYLDIGAKLPRGALLVGPPGTGKTLLAKAVAGEANVPFFSLSGSDFVEMYVGVGASRVRDLFKDANAMAPCIIFIDEIDAIGRSRDTSGRGGDSEREQTLNQLLSEMDGFDTSKGIVILAATNRPEILDKALLRPGRFDRRVIVEKPDLKGRIDTLKVHSKDVKMDETVDFEELALATSGAVGADLANIINEAALAAVKDGRQAVNQKDLFESVEVVFAGKEKKDRILSEKEKQVVAYHEIGHALVIALQKHTEPVQKITIIPRTMGALGYVMQVPEEEKYLNSKEEMLSDLVVSMGGRAAEAVKFDSVTTGASNDIEQATAKARAMVTVYGFSDKFGMVALESTQSHYLDGRRVLNCSEETATEIDKEVQKMLKKAYKQAYKLLKSHENLMDKLAAHLIEKETITGKEFMEIFNREFDITPENEVVELPEDEE
ncbi:MAG: ATP-dependent zinc metalloprotease FtsH [Lachnospiraceae bacterium]|nr:ATP-dependent zinc metalloprotease FtsH [Lachnospiraceae bacterium]